MILFVHAVFIFSFEQDVMNFCFNTIGECGNFMRFDNFIGFGVSAFGQIFFAFENPGFTHGAVEERSGALFIAEVREGVGMSDKFSAGADLLDQVYSDVGVGNLDAFDDFADHGVNFVINDELSVVECDTEVEHTCTVNEVGATLSSQ